MHFFTKKFGNIKKYSYLCGGFENPGQKNTRESMLGLSVKYNNKHTINNKNTGL
jgi:hypothetical protein